METRLIKIGNSRGVIIPKSIIDRTGSSAFNISEKGGNIILKPVDSKNNPRAGWEEQFSRSVEKSGREDDLFDGVCNDFDEEGWTW